MNLLTGGPVKDPPVNVSRSAVTGVTTSIWTLLMGAVMGVLNASVGAGGHQAVLWAVRRIRKSLHDGHVTRAG
ncbi:hypothetical protein Ssi02_29510 [Sinosporangium siamense]|uniref:Uncharacterized protein n=1 Tax=Sinosporangium siamense TaxID=1367973 RepID=A0A919RH63_9ACTN|nr:hypothetical protein Ssi02_29510 [Sinosporangium siamense]